MFKLKLRMNLHLKLQMLGLIFFSLLFGYFMTRIEKGYADSIYHFWQGTFQVMMKITDWVMLFAPVGVFGLVAKVVASTGYAAFVPLAWFFISVLSGLLSPRSMVSSWD